MDGIRDNGSGWKFRIHGMKTHTETLGKANNSNNDGESYDRKVVEAAVQSIVKVVRGFADRASDSNIAEHLRYRADNLEMVEDCDIEDINEAMGDLYDEFDYHRILVQ